MTADLSPIEKKPEVNVQVRGGSSPTYGMGMIGAWVYYFQRASTPEERLKAFLKGLVWPAYLVYELFKFLETK